MTARGDAEHKRRIGRAPGRDAAGRRLPALPSPAAVDVDNAPTPPVPAGLGPSGAAYWVHLWRASPWLTPDWDYALMRVLCRDLDEWEACCDQVAAEGRTAPGSRGQPRSHPAVAQRMALEASIARALASLGLTPMARSQLGVNEVNRVSKLDQMIERRRRAEDAQRPRNGANGSR